VGLVEAGSAVDSGAEDSAVGAVAVGLAVGLEAVDSAADLGVVDSESCTPTPAASRSRAPWPSCP